MTTTAIVGHIAYPPMLREGEIQSGILLGKDGAPDVYLILRPGDATGLTWKQAKEWAAENDGELPTRREQALLFANLKEEFKPDWYWSSEQPASDSDYAWCQHFDNGYQDYGGKSHELRARAVRRLEIQ